MPSIDLEIEEIFQKIFQKPDLKIGRTTTAHEIQGWSSLLHIRILVALEEKFQISFAPEEVVALKNIGDLMDLVKSKSKK